MKKSDLSIQQKNIRNQIYETLIKCDWKEDLKNKFYDEDWDLPAEVHFYYENNFNSELILLYQAEVNKLRFILESENKTLEVYFDQWEKLETILACIDTFKKILSFNSYKAFLKDLIQQNITPYFFRDNVFQLIEKNKKKEMLVEQQECKSKISEILLANNWKEDTCNFLNDKNFDFYIEEKFNYINDWGVNLVFKYSVTQEKLHFLIDSPAENKSLESYFVQLDKTNEILSVINDAKKNLSFNDYKNLLKSFINMDILPYLFHNKELHEVTADMIQ